MELTTNGSSSSRDTNVRDIGEDRRTARLKLEETEARIRAACARGDNRSGAAILVAEYGPRLRGFLSTMLGDRSKGDEAYSMFMGDVVEGLTDFRWESKARSFAYVLARNAAFRLLRAERRYQEFPENLWDELAAPVQTGTAPYLKTDFKTRARELLERLCPDDRALVMMHVSEGMTFKQIAKAEARASGVQKSDEAILRRTACLRKRFERVKDRLNDWRREATDSEA